MTYFRRRNGRHAGREYQKLALLFVIVCFSYRVRWARAGLAFFQGRPVSSVVDLVGEGRRDNKNRVNNQTDECPGQHRIVCVVAGVVLLSDLNTHEATYLRAENHRHLLFGIGCFSQEAPPPRRGSNGVGASWFPQTRAGPRSGEEMARSGDRTAESCQNPRCGAC